MAQKSLAVAKYILDRQLKKNDTVTPMQLIKLAYIAHGFALGTLGRALLDEEVEAWAYGPVVRSIYNAVAGTGSRPVKHINGAPERFDQWLLPHEMKILDYVCDTYGNIPAFTLSNATHKESTPWDITMKKIGGYYPVISDDLIEQFYKDQVIGKTHDRL